MDSSLTGSGSAQASLTSPCARNFSRVFATRAGRSGWPGEEYSVQRSSVMIFMVKMYAHGQNDLRMKQLIIQAAALIVILPCALGWDYEGHRLVNQLALASLPTNFPAFVKESGAAERIAFLAGEPDRWRNTTDLTLKHFNNPDHYLDFEELALCGLKAETLPPFRYVFAGQVALAHATHPTNFPPIDPAKDTERVKALIGYLPW